MQSLQPAACASLKYHLSPCSMRRFFFFFSEIENRAPILVLQGIEEKIYYFFYMHGLLIVKESYWRVRYFPKDSELLNESLPKILSITWMWMNHLETNESRCGYTSDQPDWQSCISTLESKDAYLRLYSSFTQQVLSGKRNQIRSTYQSFW